MGHRSGCFDVCFGNRSKHITSPVPFYPSICSIVLGFSELNPFRTAVPFWGQTTQISSSVSPKRDSGSKRVKACSISYDCQSHHLYSYSSSSINVFEPVVRIRTRVFAFYTININCKLVRVQQPVSTYHSHVSYEPSFCLIRGLVFVVVAYQYQPPPFE